MNMIRSLQPFKKTLLSASLFAALCASSQSYAAGTAAGSEITNTATVNFTRSTGPDSVSSNASSFKVDEIINVDVTASNPNTNITNGDRNVATSYTITNLGNGPESFKLLDSIISTDNNLDLSSDSISIYFDTSQNPDGFDPNNITETAYTSGEFISINPDETLTVYVVSNIPNTAVLNDSSVVQVTAVSQTALGTSGTDTPAIGTVIENAGENGTDAVIAVNQGRKSTDATITVNNFDASRTLAVTIEKSIIGSSALVTGSETLLTQKIPGAVVTYFIKVAVINDSAESLNISDVIPSNMTYVAGSLRKQSSVNGTIQTPTYIAPAFANDVVTPANYTNFTTLTDVNTDTDTGETLPNTGTVESIKVTFQTSAADASVGVGEYAILLDAKIDNQ